MLRYGIGLCSVHTSSVPEILSSQKPNGETDQHQCSERSLTSYGGAVNCPDFSPAIRAGVLLLLLLKPLLGVLISVMYCSINKIKHTP